MQLEGQVILLRIFVGEADRIDYKAVYEIFSRSKKGRLITTEKVKTLSFTSLVSTKKKNELTDAVKYIYF